MPQFDERDQEKKLESLYTQEEEELIRVLSGKYGHQYVNLNGVPINTDALKLIPEAEARGGMIALFEKVNKKISAAIRNPNNKNTQKVLEGLEARGFETTIYMVSTASLRHAWERYKDIQTTTASEKGVLDIKASEVKRLSESIIKGSDIDETLHDVSKRKGARRVTETLEVLLGGALALGASDVHVEPEGDAVRLRFRLDGVLSDVTDIDRDMYKLLRSRLKLLSGLKLNVDDEAQDGRFTIAVGEKDLEIRTSVIPGAYGESIVMRILDPTTIRLTMEKLGISKKLFTIIEEEIARPNGMIITTGPTGSGKTTSLYAFLQRIHKPEIKIVTLEDPIEYHLEGVVQTQVGVDYTFAGGLRSILRQDPDVIMVGEIRDRDVAETAINAALTGHLVFSTLHTNGAVGTFPRLIDLGVDARMIGSAVNLAMAQRLVRRLCNECKEAYTPNAKEEALVRSYLETVPDVEPDQPLTLYKAVGCETCSGMGYKGRIGLYEGIRVDKAVEEAIIRDPRESNILEAAKPQGILSMQQDGMLKLIEGTTTLEELTRVTDLFDTQREQTS